jgi:hypothetical protein
MPRDKTNRLFGQFFDKPDNNEEDENKTEQVLQVKQEKLAKQVEQVKPAKQVKLVKSVKQVKEKPMSTKRTFLIEDEVWSEIEVIINMLQKKQVEYINDLFKAEIEKNADKLKKFKELSH